MLSNSETGASAMVLCAVVPTLANTKIAKKYTAPTRFPALLAAGLVLLIGGTAGRASTITCDIGQQSSDIAPYHTSKTDSNSSTCAASIQNIGTLTATHTISVPVNQTTSIDMFDTFTATENTSAFGSGTLGTTHAYASFSASATPASYSYTSDYIQLDENGLPQRDANGDPIVVHFSTTDPNPLFPAGGGGAVVTWDDVITLYDPGAAPGTMLSFNISSPLDASLTSSDCSAGNATGSNVFEVDYAGRINGVNYGAAYISSASQYGNACDPAGNGSLSSTFQAPVGSALYLYGSLTLRARGGVGVNGTSFSAVADASNTGNYNLDVLTPNAFYIDENGSVNPFASPQQSAGVPEPGTVGMLCLGLAAISFARRKRKQ
jgi:hypothetical protein